MNSFNKLRKIKDACLRYSNNYCWINLYVLSYFLFMLIGVQYVDSLVSYIISLTFAYFAIIPERYIAILDVPEFVTLIIGEIKKNNKYDRLYLYRCLGVYYDDKRTNENINEIINDMEKQFSSYNGMLRYWLEDYENLSSIDYVEYDLYKINLFSRFKMISGFHKLKYGCNLVMRDICVNIVRDSIKIQNHEIKAYEDIFNYFMMRSMEAKLITLVPIEPVKVLSFMEDCMVRKWLLCKHSKYFGSIERLSKNVLFDIYHGHVRYSTNKDSKYLPITEVIEILENASK